MAHMFPRNLQQDPRFTDPQTLVSNSSIATYWTGSVGIRSHSIFDGMFIVYTLENWDGAGSFKRIDLSTVGILGCPCYYFCMTCVNIMSCGPAKSPSPSSTLILKMKSLILIASCETFFWSQHRFPGTWQEKFQLTQLKIPISRASPHQARFSCKPMKRYDRNTWFSFGSTIYPPKN